MVLDDSRKRHGRNRGIVRTLDQNQAAGCLYRAQPGRTIAIGAAENDADNLFAISRRSGLEQRIDRRTCPADFRPLAQPDAASFEEHMVVGGCYVDTTTADRSVGLSE